MPGMERFNKKSPPPSNRELRSAGSALAENLAEMQSIAEVVSAYRGTLTDRERGRLLYLGSQLYDYYLLVEDCLLRLARIFDKWVPASLDWHARLLKLMQGPVPEKRPPVISARTAAILDDYLCLYLNYHEHSAKLGPARIEKMVSNIETLSFRLENELGRFVRLLVS